jgi:hypothetical protein
MDLTRFLRDSKRRIDTNGRAGLRESIYQFYYGMWVNSVRLYDRGESIWHRDWDVLLVLDACRADVMDEVADKFDFVQHHASAISNASSSKEWMQTNFSAVYLSFIRNTAYVSGNPHTESDLPTREEFALLDETWKYGWDESAGTIKPETLTDRAIEVWRSGSYDQMIVHYMQPHFPSVPQPEFGSTMNPNEEDEGDELPGWDSIWRQLRLGNGNVEEVWDAYRENLRYVLSNVEILLRSIDAERVVITADHGNAFGEYGLYGHPSGTPIDALRKVPWCETSASDTGDYNPDRDRPGETATTDEEVEQRLSDLGYL